MTQTTKIATWMEIETEEKMSYSLKPPSELERAHDELVVRFEQTDDAGGLTGRSATFAAPTFHGLQYEDLIGHTLGTPIKIPLSWQGARVIESNLEGCEVDAYASVKTALDSPFSSRTIDLVRDGWLPSGIALQGQMTVLPDRCTITELAGRFQDGAKKNDGEQDFLDLFAGRSVRINPLLYAMEGNKQRSPSPEDVEEQFDHACSIIRAALPKAELVPAGRGGIRGVVGLINDMQAGMLREQAFLMQIAPKLYAPVSARRMNEVWDLVLIAADERQVPRTSLAVLAALSAVSVPNGKSPAKRLLKLGRPGYTEKDAYNALADLRSLEVLMHIFAMFPEEKVLLCTGDKDLALFWAGIRASGFTIESGRFAGKVSPVEALLPGGALDRWVSDASGA